ncbi:complement factor H-like [Emydura macquarii macquarii]|uniref:complement factor H-like n=1 Tax=Emydura macquarii macquarii TaxID=1129001 RepID=UPI00352A91DD
MYHCNTGFKLRGTPEITCEMGKWTSAPTCVETSCQDVPNVFNAQIEGNVKDSYEPGETVRYQCHPGFIINGSATVACKAGKWTKQPVCEDATCGAPPEVTNAQIVNKEERRYLPGDKVQYKCHEGFQSMGLNYATCEGREWSQPPICEDMTCGPPPQIHDGLVQGVSKGRYSPGDKVHYRCDRGLSLYGSLTATCQDRKWSQPPVCKGILISYF